MIGTNINSAADFLKNGDLVAIPTETVYGLAANAFDESAVLKIYKTKNRPQFNPLILHSDSLKKFKSWGIELPEIALKLAKEFSPGPLTFVVKSNNKIPQIVTAGNDSVAIRIPNHRMTLDLLQSLDFPLAAPSANPSEYISPTTAKHVDEMLGDKINYILDGGDCQIGLESTIISFLNESPEILRYGGLAIEKIENCIGKKLRSTFENNSHSKNVIAPGMLSKHYSPKHPLLICTIEDELKKYNANNCAIISFKNKNHSVPESQHFVLSETGNLDEAAKNLFAALRSADKLNVDIILTELFPNTGLGFAINDRLARAASG